MATLPTIAQKCAELHPYVAPGITYMTALGWSSAALVLGVISGWYIKGRGMAGVKVDLDNVKTDLVNLKAKVDAKVA